MNFKPTLNWLLIFVPAALVLRFWPGLSNPTALFICSAIAIIPVAGWIGHATEALAARVGEGLGGLLNATFGNAAELIIAGIALYKGHIAVVKASITGSIIGNILLVLGLSILLGGVKHKEQRFNKTGARTSGISLSLAAIALIIPTVFHYAADKSPGGWSAAVERQLSLGIAVVLFITYICMLAFSLKTHKHFFVSAEGELEEKDEHWSRGKAITILVIATAVVAVLSEFLVGTIESMRSHVRHHRSIRGRDRGGDRRQRRRALDRDHHGDEKQDGPQHGDRHRLEPSDRALCRARASLSFLRFWTPDGPRVYPPGSLRRGRVSSHPLSDQRRR